MQFRVTVVRETKQLLTIRAVTHEADKSQYNNHQHLHGFLTEADVPFLSG